MYAQLLPAVFDPAPDLPTAVEDFFAGAAETLRETGFADACPIATVALEVASTNELLRVATADVFTGWTAGLTDRFARGGIPGERARELALAFLSALEGAFVLARATRSAEPLRAAGALCAAAVRDAL